jgi:glycerol-3-phosphate O-acyltransferase
MHRTVTVNFKPEQASAKLLTVYRNEAIHIFIVVVVVVVVVYGYHPTTKAKLSTCCRDHLIKTRYIFTLHTVDRKKKKT